MQIAWALRIYSQMQLPYHYLHLILITSHLTHIPAAQTAFLSYNGAGDKERQSELQY